MKQTNIIDLKKKGLALVKYFLQLPPMCNAYVTVGIHNIF